MNYKPEILPCLLFQFKLFLELFNCVIDNVPNNA